MNYFTLKKLFMIDIKSIITTGDLSSLLKTSQADRDRMGGDRYLIRQLLSGGIDRGALIQAYDQLCSDDEEYSQIIQEFLQ